MIIEIPPDYSSPNSYDFLRSWTSFNGHDPMSTTILLLFREEEGRSKKIIGDNCPGFSYGRPLLNIVANIFHLNHDSLSLIYWSCKRIDLRRDGDVMDKEK